MMQSPPRSLRRRFMVSENGRMINIICIIIFFILSHLSPSPHPMPGVHQGGLSRDRLSPWALFGGLNPGGLAGGGWPIPPPGSSGILKASRKGIRLFSPGTEAGFLPFPKGGGGTGSGWHKPPLWEGDVKKVSGPYLRCSKSKCALTLNGSWGYPASERHCWQDQKKQYHIQCFCRKGLLLMSLTDNKAVFSFSYSLARNCLYLETGFIHSAPRACVSLAGWPALSQMLDGAKGAEGLALPLGSPRARQSGSSWPNAVSIPPSQVLPALGMPGEGSWIPLRDGPYIKGTRPITEKMGGMRSTMEISLEVERNPGISPPKRIILCINEWSFPLL